VIIFIDEFLVKNVIEAAIFIDESLVKKVVKWQSSLMSLWLKM